MFFKLAVTFLFAAIAALQVNAEKHTVTFTNKYACFVSFHSLSLTGLPM